MSEPKYKIIKEEQYSSTRYFVLKRGKTIFGNEKWEYTCSNGYGTKEEARNYVMASLHEVKITEVPINESEEEVQKEVADSGVKATEELMKAVLDQMMISTFVKLEIDRETVTRAFSHLGYSTEPIDNFFH